MELDETYLRTVARIFCTDVAKTRTIGGTPEFQQQGDIVYMRVQLQPYNAARVDSLNIWVTGGQYLRIQVAGSYVPEGGDVETQGFGHTSASEDFEHSGETPSDLVARIVQLATRMT